MAEILIVDDETAINRLICKNLELVGHSCIAVYDGEAALTILEKKKIDLVLLDIMLPKLDGRQSRSRSQTDNDPKRLFYDCPCYA